jgi:hypothetical protein
MIDNNITQPIVPQSQLNKSRVDKFLLVLDLPHVLKQYNSNNLSARSQEIINKNSIQFSVYGSVIPQILVPGVTAPYAGQSYKASSHGRPPYENVTVNFTVDNMFNNYWVIYKWLNLLNDDQESIYNAANVLPQSNTTLTKLPKILQPQSYQVDLSIYGKDEFDNNVIRFTYTKAFPVSLDGIEYNYRESNEVESNFTFAFSQFFAELL